MTNQENTDLSVDGAAQRSGMSRETIRRYLKDGLFPNAYKRGAFTTSPWRIPAADVDAYRGGDAA